MPDETVEKSTDNPAGTAGDAPGAMPGAATERVRGTDQNMSFSDLAELGHKPTKLDVNAKPVIEVIAALPAGLVLGLLAMRARSIWGGVLVHVAVAWLMDALALVQGPGLPQRLWPCSAPAAQAARRARPPRPRPKRAH